MAAGLHQQIALVASPTDGAALTAWDVRTGTLVATWKGNSCNRNCLSLVGRDYVAAAQTGKGSLHFWTWHKDQLLQRSFTLEPITAVVASPDGSFVAGGAASGTVYIWQTGTGRLMRSWPAHYKTVTALVFSQDGSLLLSGGEDTAAHCWTLMELLDAEAHQPGMQQQPINPRHSWSQHTLPVTDIHVGAGQLNAIAITASLDRTCRVWSIAQGTLLQTFTFESALRAVTADPGEHTLYAGAVDGCIFAGDLIPGSSRPEAAGGPMQSSSAPVNCLACTPDATQLVAGCEDGALVVWDLPTRQPVRTLQMPAKGPISAVLVMDRPMFLPGSKAGSRGLAGISEPGSSSLLALGSASSKGPQRAQPLAPFQKYMSGSPSDAVPVLLDGSLPYRGIVQESGLAGLVSGSVGSKPGGSIPAASAAHGPAAGATSAAKVLQQQNDQLQAKLEEALDAANSWKSLHGKLHQFCVQQLLSTGQFGAAT